MELRHDFELKNGSKSFLNVYFNNSGDLCFSGFDTNIPEYLQFGFDDDYEYCKIIVADQIPELKKILNIQSENIQSEKDFLHFLKTHYVDEKSFVLERIINQAAKDGKIKINKTGY